VAVDQELRRRGHTDVGAGAEVGVDRGRICVLIERGSERGDIEARLLGVLDQRVAR
jgi:uncharacterized protein (UPF0254 family)